MKKRASYKHFIVVTIYLSAILVSVESAQLNFPEDELTVSEVESHLRFLASDELMGRKPGTYGADIAARYIAEQFREAMLKTFSDSIDYFQLTHLVLQNKCDSETNDSKVESITSKNVIGYIEGSDPGLKKEFVLLCAHYDHLGAGHLKGSTETDIIFNGARDNGMGTVALICAAKAFSIKPNARSIVFIAFTGEEEGCLGSQYFVENPLISLDKIVFVLNNDGGGFNDTNLIRIAGLERYSIKKMIIEAIEKYELSVLLYPSELQYLYELSDNMPFAQKGIPAITVSPGFDKIDNEILKYIHTVEDEADDTFNYSYLLKFTRAYISIARAIADTPYRFQSTKQTQKTKMK
jgi:Zn-dependent M28 family amino/carboxypeptidase